MFHDNPDISSIAEYPRKGNTDTNILYSLFGAVFPLFSTAMFNGLGVNWAGTLLGCVAALLVPIPIVFWKHGGRIRARSKFAPTMKPKPMEDSVSVSEE